MLFKINYSLDALKGVNFEREFESVAELCSFATLIEVINTEREAGRNYLPKILDKEIAEKNINYYWKKVFDENSNDILFNPDFISDNLYYEIRDILDYELEEKDFNN